jgi:hypothetical protein
MTPIDPARLYKPNATRFDHGSGTLSRGNARSGARLLVDLAAPTGMSKAMSYELGSLRQRQSGHDPGRVVLDLAVLLADGGEAISDPAVLRNQSDLFGPVASDPIAWRVLAALDDEALSRLRDARHGVVYWRRPGH